MWSSTQSLTTWSKLTELETSALILLQSKMRTSEIHKALSTHPLTLSTFGGVFARNKVLSVPAKKTVSYVVNTHPNCKSGEHWVAFHFTPTVVYYFDPYGLPARKAVGFERLLKARRRRKFFNQRLQGKGPTCGHYCWHFILTRQSSRHDMNIFSHDYESNNRIVKQQVLTHFGL